MAINWGINVGTTSQQGNQALSFLQQALARGEAAAPAAAPGAAPVTGPVPTAVPAAPAVDVPAGNAAVPTAFGEPVAHAADDAGGIRAAVAETAETAAGTKGGWFAQLRSTPADDIFSILNGGRPAGERAGVHAADLIEQARAVVTAQADEVAAGTAKPLVANLFHGVNRMNTSAAEIGKLGAALSGSAAAAAPAAAAAATPVAETVNPLVAKLFQLGTRMRP